MTTKWLHGSGQNRLATKKRDENTLLALACFSIESLLFATSRNASLPEAQYEEHFRRLISIKQALKSEDFRAYLRLPLPKSPGGFV